jgi:hypothetical protein
MPTICLRNIEGRDMARRDYEPGHQIVARYCGKCGGSLAGRRSDALYCCRRCKEQARRQGRRPRDRLATVNTALLPIEAAIMLDAAAGMVIVNTPTSKGTSSVHKHNADNLRRIRKRLEWLGLIRLVGRCRRHPVHRATEMGWLLVSRRYAELLSTAATVTRINRWWAVERQPANLIWPCARWPRHVDVPDLWPNPDR